MKPKSQPKHAQPVTLEQLKAIRQQIDEVSGVLEAAILYVEKKNELAVYNFPSGIVGAARLQSFGDAIRRSLYAAQIGKPIEPGQLKPRSTAKRATKKKPKQ